MPHTLAAIVALAMTLLQPAPLVQSVDLAVPLAPVYFRQNGAAQMVYELHITNFLQTEVSLAAVTARDGNGIVLAQYEDAELRRRITRPGLRNDHATPHLIGPGMRAIVNIWIAVPPTSGFVRTVTHAVELDVIRPTETIRARATGGAASTDFSPVPELDAPLRGGPWIAIYDPLLKGGHRTAIYTLDGRARIPGRFAIDFIALPQAGALPAERTSDANGFGADVLAVADGTVTIAVDGVPDATPPPMSLERASGNHIAIDVGGGRFAFYEHLQMGSVKVKAGERVKRGEVIARLGSSGSSSIGPHLHFHVSDASATLAAEGMPFVFRQFTQIGRFASLAALTSGEKWLPTGSAVIHQHERPDPVTVLHFP
jgi:murein DD-endopeptidase